MTYRLISPDYAVSPQISPDDIQMLAQAGFTTILCNRPDAEIPQDLHASVMEQAAQANGLSFVHNPVVHTALTHEIVDAQKQVIDDGGKVLAYCASGTRSTIVWMLGQAPTVDADTLLSAARSAGYQLDGMRPQLDALYLGGSD